MDIRLIIIVSNTSIDVLITYGAFLNRHRDPTDDYLVLRAFPALDFDFIKDLLPLDPVLEEDFPLIALLFLLSLLEILAPFPLELFEMMDPLPLFTFLDDLMENPFPVVHEPPFLLFFELFPANVLKRVDEEHILVVKPKVVS